MKTILHFHPETETYVATSGHTLRRENGLTPNGNPLNGRWVLRDPDGQFLDFDQYRNDLAERHELRLIGNEGKPMVQIVAEAL